MQLTRHTDYAIRTLIYLGDLPAGERAQIQAICEHFAISQNHLSKVVNQLAREGFVDTLRGRGGGICLAKAPTAINLGELIRKTENSLQLIDCNKPPCTLRANCRFKDILGEAMTAFLATMDGYTLADILDSELQALPL